MKNLILLSGILLITQGNLFSQTDEFNLDKYWKIRNSFRRDFVKIGFESGESIPAVTRKPNACPDNVDWDGDKGTMRWGDGMIMQGHYIGFLATEYKLLKNKGEDYWGTLNELYYAIQAINRVDRNAAFLLSTMDENELPDYGPNLNGFYLRDDAPNDMYENWQEAKIKCRCTEGDIFESNNAAQENSGGNFAKYRQRTNGHSLPSLDQMTSLLVGLTLCDKLLDDDLYVKPTSDDPVLNLKDEVHAITNRLISYASDHNWFLLNERGWPVGNGGGELLLTCYPIALTGYNMTGTTSHLFSPIIRKAYPYNTANIYYSAPPSKRPGIWDTLNIFQKIQVDNFVGPNLWESGGLSNFEFHQLSGSYEATPLSFTGFWTSFTPDRLEDVANDLSDNDQLNELLDGHPFKYLSLPELGQKDYNQTIVFNLGVSSQLFSNSLVAIWGNTTRNYQLVLVDALLKGGSPIAHDKAFFQDILNSFPVYGGFKFTSQIIPSGKYFLWAKYWAAEYKWNDDGEANSSIGHEGQYSSLDYLYIHNLYHLVFDEEIETNFKEEYSCICDEITWDDIDALEVLEEGVPGIQAKRIEDVVADDFWIYQDMKDKLKYLEFCTPNTFEIFLSNELFSTYELKQQFDSYHDIGISLNDYQTNNFVVKSSGVLNIESRLVICEDKTLTIESGGEVNLDKGEIRINSGAELIVEGTVNVGPYTEIIMEPEAKIIIKNGGVLNNLGYIHVKSNAAIEYEEGAALTMKDDDAEIHFDGGDLVIKENADFTFEKGGAQSGQLRFSIWGKHVIAEANTSFLLQGNGDADPVLVLDKNADFWTSSEMEWITLSSGKVVLDKNARFVAIPKLTVNNTLFESTDTTRGIVCFDHTNISNTTFNNTSIFAPLYFRNSGTFNMTLSEINHTTEEEMIQIDGMGYTISNSTFNGAAEYMLSAKNTTEYSRILNTTFNGTLTTVGVIDNSNGTVEINKCNFNTLYAGIHKLDGKAIVRCNQFSGFKYAGVVAQNNCTLDMSGNGQGGYNIFAKNGPDFGTNIALWNAKWLLLNKGYNSFDDQGNLPIIDGTLQTLGPPGMLITLTVSSNQWNAANTFPPTSDFNVSSSTTGESIGFLASTPESTTCPISDDGDIAGTYMVIPNYQGNEGVINTVNFANVTLSDALNTCIEASKVYDTNNSNLAALQLFEEVLMTYTTIPNSYRNEALIHYGAGLMKQTIQDAFSTGEINRDQNNSHFHQGVQFYVNVLNELTSVAMSQENYRQLFYLEMDKAHLFHLLGKDNLALHTILNAESCGLDSTEQKHLNHWKFVLDEQIRKENYGYQAEFKDTNWVDTTFYTTPSGQVYGEFGSRIVDANTIEFFSCGGQLAPLKEAGANNAAGQLSVYPNPNDGSFQVVYNLPENSNGIIVVHNHQGKEIQRFKCQTGEHTQTVDITGVEAGNYIYTYYINGVLTKTGKVVVR